MRKSYLLLFLLSILGLGAKGQTSFEIHTSIGRTCIPSVRYQNCTGNFSTGFAPSVSFIYHPDHASGFEISYNGLKPTIYLNDPSNRSLSIYTRSIIHIDRLLTGINYSFPFTKIHPYVGCPLGFTCADTTQTPWTSSYTGISWACQPGVNYYFSSSIGLRLNGAIINSHRAGNNSANFNIDKSGGDFPPSLLLTHPKPILLNGTKV
jgi:hypothetical protein